MEQLKRAKRYLIRLEYAYEGIQEPSATFSIENVKDDCISFFMHCYHVKDWIKAIHCSDKKERDDVEEYINNNKELTICADICNGTKHYKIQDKFRPRSGNVQKVNTTHHERMVYITGTGGLETQKCELSIVSKDNDDIDALILAKRCIELWGEYLSRIK